jgi:hypothetical protein
LIGVFVGLLAVLDSLLFRVPKPANPNIAML